ncbi:MAG: hypothetical protein ACYDGS_09035 [Thermoleophilia bacterium]
MALDPQMLTLRCSQHLLKTAATEACSRGWSVVKVDDSFLSLLRNPYQKNLTNIDSFNGLFLNSRNNYETLDKLGLLAIQGDISPGDISLTGGSVCSCKLLRSGEEWQVHKRVSSSSLGPIDTHERHLAESEYIAKLIKNGITLFPVVQSQLCDGFLELEYDFYYSYTLGERMLQGFVTSDNIYSFVKKLFKALETNLYCHLTDTEPELYTTKVSRRLTFLFKHESVGPFCETLYERGAVIDGLACRPIAQQLSDCMVDERTKNVLTAARSCLCHGDLIPEDILMNDMGDFKLIDPNPQNADPIVDLAKFAMSSLISYDLALRDWIHCNVSRSKTGQLVVDTGVPADWENFQIFQEELGTWICESASALVDPIYLPKARCDPRGIMLLAGLQAMAIPVFHVNHHIKYIRGQYFLSRGQHLVEKALRLWKI